MRWLWFILLYVLACPALAAPEKDKEDFAIEVCQLLRSNADTNGLPVEFFTRLIWRESYFNPQALSPAGAEGIAQFMPQTAQRRGLKNSYNHRAALAASALYLADLKAQFGNLGLAAAAYNAGETALADWLAGRRRFMPIETEDYVLAITGHVIDDWRKPGTQLDIPSLGGKQGFEATCRSIVLREQLPTVAASRALRVPVKPWGALLSAGFSESRTLAAFSRIKRRYAVLLANELPLVLRKRNLSRGRRPIVRVMVGRNTRQEAQNLCERLRQAGAACIVARN